jgi:hypothetical protein
MSRFSRLGRLARDVFEFMNTDKLWWMSPILILLLLAGGFLIVVEGSALAPLIYAMF